MNLSGQSRGRVSRHSTASNQIDHHLFSPTFLHETEINSNEHLLSFPQSWLFPAIIESDLQHMLVNEPVTGGLNALNNPQAYKNLNRKQGCLHLE